MASSRVKYRINKQEILPLKQLYSQKHTQDFCAAKLQLYNTPNYGIFFILFFFKWQELFPSITDFVLMKKKAKDPLVLNQAW